MSFETVPTSDLRREGKEAKRDHDRRAKWAYGAREKGPKGQVNTMLRPNRPLNRVPWKRSNEHNINQIARGERTAFRRDVKETFEDKESDSSAIQDTSRLNALDWRISAPEDDTHLSYEVSGNKILFAAVLVAEEEFETREFEKLMKEYEFVTEGTDERGYMTSDDEFQLVEYHEL